MACGCRKRAEKASLSRAERMKQRADAAAERKALRAAKNLSVQKS